MRIYIIGNDGIILCREPPTTVNEGEIVVASNEELHAARLSGKRLLALWNALPDVEKRKKVGDRDALVVEILRLRHLQLVSLLEHTFESTRTLSFRAQTEACLLELLGYFRRAD